MSSQHNTASRQYADHGYVQLTAGDLDDELAELRRLLQAALKLEHATIPVYLFGLYSMHDEMDFAVVDLVRSTVVEEMLHMLLVANVLNAVGGQPALSGRDFVLAYPAKLPYDVDNIVLQLLPFGPDFVAQGLEIERPKWIDPERVAARSPQGMTIGEFYLLIESRLRAIVAKFGEPAVFTGDSQRQVRPDMFYYGSGGDAVAVCGLNDALRALRLIALQGEGTREEIWEPGPVDEPLPAHFYRFNELSLQRRYRHGDTAASGPSGEALSVPYTLAYQALPNPSVESYPLGSELRSAADAFVEEYRQLLSMLEQAFRGHPATLSATVPRMLRLKAAAQRILRNPLPSAVGDAVNASPPFGPSSPPKGRL